MANQSPDPADLPDKCEKCGGSGTSFANGNVEDCSRCEGTGLEPDNDLSDDQRQVLGLGGGAALGFSLGGPAGAVVGGLIGAALTSTEDNEDEDEMGLDQL